MGSPDVIYITYTLRSQYKNHGSFGENKILTKSYEDGIMDALKVVSKWDHVAIVYSVINTIENQLIKLLPPEFDLSQNKHYDSLKNITEISND